MLRATPSVHGSLSARLSLVGGTGQLSILDGIKYTCVKTVVAKPESGGGVTMLGPSLRQVAPAREAYPAWSPFGRAQSS